MTLQTILRAAGQAGVAHNNGAGGEFILVGTGPQLEALERALQGGSVQKLWLWKNFAGGRPEYWAFDNAFPINLDNGDPQTLGEPCGYAIVKPSRQGRTDVSETEVLRRIAGVTKASAPQPLADAARVLSEFAKTAPGRLPQRVQNAIAAVDGVRVPVNDQPGEPK